MDEKEEVIKNDNTVKGKIKLSKGERLNNAFHNVLFALTIALLGYILYNYIVVKDPAKIFYFGYKPAIIISGSMEPVIKQNGLIVIKKAGFNDVKVGDIIAFKYGNALVSHKVIAKYKNNLQTKGVNNLVPDPFRVKKNMIVGKVVFISNVVAWLILSFKTPINIFLWILLIALVVVFIVLLKKLLRKDKPDAKSDN